TNGPGCREVLQDVRRSADRGYAQKELASAAAFHLEFAASKRSISTQPCVAGIWGNPFHQSAQEEAVQGESMFTPHSLSIALLMMITSAICWGSWANTYKGVKGYRFELFYWDYAVGIFLISLVLAFTMGSTGNSSSSFLNNIHAADASNIVNALIGGALFNLANLLLVAAIDMAGLAVAFPISIGIALVVGTVLSYALQPRGHATLLALGVACAFIAVLMD